MKKLLAAGLTLAALGTGFSAAPAAAWPINSAVEGINGNNFDSNNGNRYRHDPSTQMNSNQVQSSANSSSAGSGIVIHGGGTLQVGGSINNVHTHTTTTHTYNSNGVHYIRR